MATVLPFLEPRFQSHYFLDTPRRMPHGIITLDESQAMDDVL